MCQGNSIRDTTDAADVQSPEKQVGLTWLLRGGSLNICLLRMWLLHGLTTLNIGVLQHSVRVRVRLWFDGARRAKSVTQLCHLSV